MAGDGSAAVRLSPHPRTRARDADARDRLWQPPGRAPVHRPPCTGNYHGIDISPPILLAALRTVADFGLQAKAPRLTLVDDLTLNFLPDDGYDVLYGDLNDPRLWEPMVVSTRKLNILTEPNLELSAGWIPALSRRYPELRLIVIVSDEVEAEKFAALNLRSVIYRPEQGHDLALKILLELGVDPEDAANWIRKSYNIEREFVAA